MDDSKKQTIALCAAFIAAPRLMFLDQDSAPALRAVLSDSVWKAELLLEHIDARGPNRNATRPAAKTDPYFDLKNELHAGPPPGTAGRRFLGLARFWFRVSAHSSNPVVRLRAVRFLDRSRDRLWPQGEWRYGWARARQCARAAVRPSTPSRTKRRGGPGRNPDRETSDAERR